MKIVSFFLYPPVAVAKSSGCRFEQHLLPMLRVVLVAAHKRETGFGNFTLTSMLAVFSLKTVCALVD
jgi:hypothetical protein